MVVVAISDIAEGEEVSCECLLCDPLGKLVGRSSVFSVQLAGQLRS